MLKKLFILIVAASALGACDDSSQPTATTAPAPVAPPSFMTFFDLGSTKLSDQDKTTVSQAAQVYKSRANARVTVTGYADTVGSPAANLQLSQRRATVVKDALVAAGVPATAITTSGSGDASLLVETGPQQKEPRNRRVAIVIN